jgi:hypothetical protein
MSGPSNMRNFTENSYNLTSQSGGFCVKPGSIYTNQYGDLNYFSKNCLDPYTAYAYWYRRFPDQTKYLNCYNIPYKDVLLHNKWGYVKAGNNCSPPPNNHWNEVSGGFKFYDSRINAPTKRVVLTKYT